MNLQSLHIDQMLNKEISIASVSSVRMEHVSSLTFCPLTKKFTVSHNGKKESFNHTSYELALDSYNSKTNESVNFTDIQTTLGTSINIASESTASESKELNYCSLTQMFAILKNKKITKEFSDHELYISTVVETYNQI